MKNLHVVYSLPDDVELEDLVMLPGVISYNGPAGETAIGSRHIYIEETVIAPGATVAIQYCGV